MYFADMFSRGSVHVNLPHNPYANNRKRNLMT